MGVNCSKMFKTFMRAFGGFFKVLHKLFLETTGMFFLILAGLILYSGYGQIRHWQNFGEVSWFKLSSTLLFGVLMLGYGIHSFYRVRIMR
jgi:hypothetical protein